MLRIGKWFSDAGLMVGLAVLVVVSLPLLAMASVALRFVFLVGIPLLLVGGLLAYASSKRFRAWLSAVSEVECIYKGLRLDRAVAMHRDHGWARLDGEATLVGADDLAQAAIGPVDAVELPPVGFRVRQGEPLFVLRHADRSLAVRSPLSGTIARVNSEVRTRPELVNDDPFGRGWTVVLQGDRARDGRGALLRGDAARSWFRDEVDRLIAVASGPTPLPVLADGGLLVGELHRRVAPADWDRIKTEIFGGGSRR